jgi:YesN/AraC family two-component response regulator
VLLANNGGEGLRLLQTSTADLVITDIFMPEKDGLEVTATLRRLFPKLRIIAISGGTADFDYLDVVKNLGAHRALRKPLIVKELLETIRQELRIASGHTGEGDAQ